MIEELEFYLGIFLGVFLRRKKRRGGDEKRNSFLVIREVSFWFFGLVA